VIVFTFRVIVFFIGFFYGKTSCEKEVFRIGPLSRILSGELNRLEKLDGL